ncbi:MAG: alpha/beta hydrolase [Dehalococcoidia bacterium]|nr:alpha/beta hydrolase [Dehalococcoidia bacterium]
MTTIATRNGGKKMAIATINGVDLWYEDTGGNGPVIVLHHGYTGSHDTWTELIAPRLKDRYRCISMDTRGAGDSGHPEGGYTISQYALDVLGLMDHLGISAFTYCGHSMGGVVGMELGINHAARLDRLILVAPAPADGIDAPAAMHERSRALREAGDRETMISERTIMAPREGQEERIRRAVDRALSVSEGHFEQSWEELRDSRRGDALYQMQVPTLVIAGAADGLLPHNLLDFQRLPNATLHVFSRVAHSVPSDVPEEFSEVVADFMEHGVVNNQTQLQKLEDAKVARI